MVRAWIAVAVLGMVLVSAMPVLADEEDPTLALWESVHERSERSRRACDEIVALDREEALQYAIPFLRAADPWVRSCAARVAKHHLSMIDMPLLLDEWARAQEESLKTRAPYLMTLLISRDKELTWRDAPDENDPELVGMWAAIQLDVDEMSRTASRVRVKVLDLDPAWGLLEVWPRIIGSPPSAVAMVVVRLTPEEGESFRAYDEIWVRCEGEWTRMAGVSMTSVD